MYIVMAIAANDIFVFCDAWRQSKSIAPDILTNKKKRMAYTWRRSSRAMATTSFTIASAMLANIFSDFMPIISFGIFTAIIITTNFFIIVCMLPPATILQDKYKFCCCCPYRNKTAEERYEDDKPKVEEMPLMERVFDKHINTCVSRFKYLLTALSLIWTVFVLRYAVQIGPSTEANDFISDDNPVMQPFTLVRDEFQQMEEEKTNVNIFFGVEGVNRSRDD